MLKKKMLVLLLTLFILGQANARGIAQTITLSEKNVSIARVFKEITRQTGYTFVYTRVILEKAKNVSVVLSNAQLEQVLDSCFKNQPLTYAIVNKMIIVKEQENTMQPSSQKALPPKNIKGKITGDKDEALGGATVSEKGTDNSTVTKEDGSFSIDVSKPDATLTVSYVGFETREFRVNNLNNLNIALVQITSSLNDVVVVGYGTQKRKDLTGSVTSVTNKDFADLPVSRIDQALVGKVAGVQVKTTNGEPGASPQIRVRGIGSISAGASPLYVVDGFPTNSIDNLNPNDIESLDILKDASATAIYGSRGSNGVVIINTKRGSSGKANISFNTYHGWQQLSKRPDFMNAREQAQYHYEGIRQNNIDLGNDVSGAPGSWKVPVPPYTLDVLSGKITYDRFALDDVIRTAPQHDYSLSATGGNDNVKYSLSGDYLDQDGIVLGSAFKRYSLRANVDAKLSNRISVKVNINPSFIARNLITASGSSSSSNEGVVGSAFGVNPMYPLLNPDGTYFVFIPGLDVTSNAQNPLALAKEITNRQKKLSLLANVSLDYKIYDDLRFNVLAGTVLQSSKGYRFKPQIAAFFNEPAVGTDNAALNYNWLTEYTLNYTKKFGNHNIAALAGFTTQKETNESNTLTSNRFPNNLVPTLSATSGLITDGSSDIYQWSLVSYLGRINYNYNSKYYVTASFRTDGSSRFGSERKFGLFPSAALAYRISEENFLKNVSWLSELKLRASYGETGNNNIGNYEQFATINYDRTVLGGAVAGGFSQAKLANALLTWEKQRQLNLGVDAAFFKNRLRLSVDHFRSRNTDLLLNVNVPDITGFSTSLKNIGEVKNNGWDIVFSTTNIDSKNFQWSTDLNFSTFKNEVVKLGPTGDPIYGGSSHITQIGQPIGMFFGWVTDGIFLNNAELAKGPIYNPGGVDRSRAGDIRFKDISGPNGKPDGVINNFDKTIIGSPYPDFYYGITNRVSYKNLSLTVSLQGSKGAQIFAESRSASMATRGRFGQLSTLNNYWVSETQTGNGKTPRPNNAPTGNIRGTYSTWFLDSGSFMRINNVTLAYVLPENIARRMTMRSVRIYASANNPFLFTKNTGFNPEASNLEDPLRPGRELSDYPIPRSLILGVNISFNN